MATGPTRVLLLGDRPEDLDRLRLAVDGRSAGRFEATAAGADDAGAFDLALVVLGTDPRAGLATAGALAGRPDGPTVVVVVPPGPEGEAATAEALSLGAQDALSWDEVLAPGFGPSLVKALTRGHSARRLRASVAAFRDLSEFLSVMAWSADAGRVVDRCNRSTLAYLGRDAADAAGWTWDAYVHPEDLPAARLAWEEAGRAGAEFRGEFRIRRGGDGAYLWHETQARPQFDPDGRVVHWHGATTDVDERRRAVNALYHREQEFRALVENAPEIITRFDREFRHLYVNPAVEKATGLPASTFLGRSSRQMGMPAESCDYWEAKLREAFETRREVRLEFNWEGPGGRSYFQARLVPEFDLDGNVRSVLGISTDVTERRQLQESEERLRKQAEESSRAKSHFLANMSHEIRTPMTAVLGYADLLLRQVTDADDRQCVETIRRNGLHLLDLINDILDLTRIEAGRMRVERRTFRPDEAATEVVSLMKVRAAEKGLTLALEFRGRLPETVESDPTRLRQVLVNLVGNAIKFTESGSVRVVVGFEPGDGNVEGANPHRLRFEVVDTGVGMSVDQVGQIFEPFAQADMTVTRRFGGSGLGLAISQRLVELLGGTIEVDTRPGEGSLFRFTAAVGLADGVAFVEPSGTAPPAGPAEPPPTYRLDCRVLVVDDRPDIRSLARQFLEEAGARVATADNGEAAIKALRHGRAPGGGFDVVVLDMQMPELDGYQTTRELRASGFDRPIIALTASAMLGDRERCLAAGCDDYLTKPIDPRALVKAVGSAARGRKAPEARPGLRVLLVDDSEDLCRFTARLLRDAGHHPRSVGDGRSALELVRDFRPEVVLLDLGLPDMTGHELFARLREVDGLEGATFIALTGRDAPDERERSLRSGFREHVVKPFEIDDLLRLFPA